MRKTRLGKAGPEVTPLCLGTWAMGGWLWGGTDYKASVDAIVAAVEGGINFIDTAPVYGGGLSERMIADAFGGAPPPGIVIATKTGMYLDEATQKPVRSATRDELLKTFEASLGRLKVSRVDILFVHWPDYSTPIEETAATMRELFAQGAIGAIGLSNYSHDTMQAFAKHAPVHIIQPPYNLFEREYEARVLPHCLKHEIGVMVYGTMCQGLLTGKYDKKAKFQKGDHRTTHPQFHGERLKRNLEFIDQLGSFAANRGMTMAEVAIAWTLANRAVHCAIVGARNAAQIRGNLRAAEFDLPEEDLFELEKCWLDARFKKLDS